MDGVGLHVLVSVEKRRIGVEVRLRSTGKLSAVERKAIDLVRRDTVRSPEMMAGLLEQLVALVPVLCACCGKPKDVQAVVAHVRARAVLS